MSNLENELGKVYVYTPDGAKLNLDNKPSPPPEVKYEKRRTNIVENVTKNLCGGKYGRSDNTKR
jgi:hypothetical protein